MSLKNTKKNYVDDRYLVSYRHTNPIGTFLLTSKNVIAVYQRENCAINVSRGLIQ